MCICTTGPGLTLTGLTTRDISVWSLNSQAILFLLIGLGSRAGSRGPKAKPLAGGLPASGRQRVLLAYVVRVI